MQKLQASEFTLNALKKMKRSRKIAVVFSTFGEREAELVADKISLFSDELSPVIDSIVLSHRRTGSGEDRTERAAFAAYPAVDIFVCNNFTVPDMRDESGKGADMPRGLYYLAARKGYADNDVIVYLDSDVVPEHFGIHFFLGLAGAVLSGAEFAKASFWRKMGRVRKYVAQPLFSVVRHELLDGLADFHYPLSGEVAGTVSFFCGVSFWQMYGVETGILIDALMQKRNIADVNMGRYDHEHSGEFAIQKMSFGIIRTYLKKLEEYGLLEFRKGAALSDLFHASIIDEDGGREEVNAELAEVMYQPLHALL